MSSILRVLRPVLNVLPEGSRRFLIGYAVALASLALLDLGALGLMGAVMQSLVVTDPLTLPVVGDLATAPAKVTAVAIISVLIVLKGGLNVALLRMATKRFARHEVAIGDRLLAAYMSSPWEDRLSKNSAELVRTVDAGVGTTVSGVLIPSVSLAGEVGTFTAVLVALVVFDPVIAAVTIAYFAVVAVVLAKIISPIAVRTGGANRRWSERTVRLLTEALGALKEVTLAGRSQDVQDRVHETRTHSSSARAQTSFLGQVPRYVLEASLILGVTVIGGVAYLMGGMAQAIGAVGMFAVAGFRLVPTLTRFQAVQSQVNSSASFARRVVEEIAEGEAILARRRAERPQRELPPTARDLTLHEVTFTYPGGAAPALHEVSLTIPAGAHVAFVGSSGAGKSTLVDIILGLLEPTSGHLTVGAERLEYVLDSWRRGIGYVPQDVSLFDASVGENVALTWDPAKVDEEKVRHALARAQLLETVEARPGGIHAPIGERGIALSGGQRQRLGIARGLYHDPRVLVMDEATSALDTATEAAITRAIAELHGTITVVTVAHRLATIRGADIVFFLRDAELVAQGSFDEVVRQVPDFAQQAALAGLTAAEEPTP